MHEKRTVLPRHTGQSDRVRPSVEITATRQGMNLPLCCNARLTAFSMPPQQGTSMRAHGHALDIVFTQDGGELFRVVALIQLGASDERYAAADEILVKRTVGVRGAVRRDEQSCALKIRRVHRSKLDLDRPLGQRAGGTGDGAVRRGGFTPDAAGTAAGASAGLRGGVLRFGGP